MAVSTTFSRTPADIRAVELAFLGSVDTTLLQRCINDAAVRIVRALARHGIAATSITDGDDLALLQSIVGEGAASFYLLRTGNASSDDAGRGGAMAKSFNSFLSDLEKSPAAIGSWTAAGSSFAPHTHAQDSDVTDQDLDLVFDDLPDPTEDDRLELL